MGARQPIPRESTKDTVKPSRREGRNAPVVPVVPAPCTFSRTGAMGVASTRSSLRPLQLLEGHLQCIPRAPCAARARWRVFCCSRCECGFSNSVVPGKPWRAKRCTTLTRDPYSAADVMERDLTTSLPQTTAWGYGSRRRVRNCAVGRDDSGVRGASTVPHRRHCERSEAIQDVSAKPVWIASAQGRLAMTEFGASRVPAIAARMWSENAPRAGKTYDDNRMSSRRRPSLRSSFFTALEATTSPSLA
jgi:hypothetical protein